MVSEDDWRIRRQGDYLKGKTFYFHEFAQWSDTWDHEHCEFCWRSFSDQDGDEHNGYSTLDDFTWVCPQCFNDFKDVYSFNLLSESTFSGKTVLDVLRKEIGQFQNEDLYRYERMINLLKKMLEADMNSRPMSLTPVLIQTLPMSDEEPIIEMHDQLAIRLESGEPNKVLQTITELSKNDSLISEANDKQMMLYIKIADEM